MNFTIWYLQCNILWRCLHDNSTHGLNVLSKWDTEVEKEKETTETDMWERTFGPLLHFCYLRRKSRQSKTWSGCGLSCGHMLSCCARSRTTLLLKAEDSEQIVKCRRGLLICVFNQHLIMKTQKNRRGFEEHVWESRHLKLNDLREEARDLRNIYLPNDFDNACPRPEFHVTHLKHDTDRDGLCGIWRDNGFESPHKDSLVWWSLAVTPDDITSAERRLLEATYPDRTQEQVQMQQSFLGKFASSPAFSERSRLGSYRFTFPLEEVLEAYSQQVLRVRKSWERS